MISHLRLTTGLLLTSFALAACTQAPAPGPQSNAAQPGAAQAAAPAMTPEQMAAQRARFRAAFIEQYDTNRDGVITRAEYDAVRDARFRATDTNRDGSLSEAEYVGEYETRLRAEYGSKPIDETFQRQIRQASRRFETIDRDRDLKISRAEYDRVANNTFTRADTNGDGRISPEDATAPHAAPRQPRN